MATLEIKIAATVVDSSKIIKRLTQFAAPAEKLSRPSATVKRTSAIVASLWSGFVGILLGYAWLYYHIGRGLGE